MEKFKFEMNGYKNVCYVFRDLEREPVDTLSLIETKNDDAGNLEKGWIPQSYFVQRLLCDFKEDLEAVKEFYNENYEEICENLFPKDLLGFPEVISGYYVSNIVGGIMVSGEVREKDRVGVAYSGEQAKGIQAFCELSQILPIFNEGWESDFVDGKMKWCIKTAEGKVKIVAYYICSHFLAFETEEKAKLFLKEKIDLITDLSKAKII